MTETLVWAIVTLTIAAMFAWRMERLARQYFQAKQQAQAMITGEKEAALMERRTAAEIANQTLDEATELRRVQLTQEAAILQALADEHLESAREVLAAQTAAKVALAPEFAREDHAAKSRDLVGEYERYLDNATDRGVHVADFDEFVDIMNKAR